jgi:hypothetical protein
MRPPAVPQDLAAIATADPLGTGLPTGDARDLEIALGRAPPRQHEAQVTGVQFPAVLQHGVIQTR